MWYAIQTIAGREERVKTEAEILIPDTTFKIIYRKGCFKYKGEWHNDRLVLFSGYVFAITDNPVSVYKGLRMISGLSKLVRFDDVIIPISPDEQRVLENMLGDDDIIDNSIGIIDGDTIIVTDGPLAGFESKIRRIDRHKRLAFVEFNMGDNTIEIQMNLEIVSKK